MSIYVIWFIILGVVFLLGWCAGSQGSDWEAQREFRITVYEKCFKLESQIKHLSEHNADLENRLQCEHELRRELEKRVEASDGPIV